MDTRIRGRLPLWRRLGWRLGASFLVLTALGIFLSGLLQYRAQDRWLRQSLGALLLNIARTGALMIDPGLHGEVQVTRTQDSDAYRRLRKTLAAIQDVNQLETPIYTLSDYEPATHRSHFVVTSRGPGRPGEVYEIVPAVVEAFERAFRAGAATNTDVYQNPHGTWITAFAPVKDAEGRTIAMLDVDYKVDVYLAQVATLRRQLYLHALAGAVLALVAGGIMARRITRPVQALTMAARGVVEGDLTARVRVPSRDEIGLLGNVFHLMVERLQVSHRSMVDVLVRALEARAGGPGSLGRVAAAARLLAEGLELSPAQREALELGALLHDIGEIRTPEAILQKPGPLSPEERRLVEQHPQAGVEILETVPLLTPALDIVGSHQERYDGAGYPAGLREEAIPLTARVFAVADALDAMTHDRPYRPARPLAEALAVVRDETGKQFDPRIAAAALAIPKARWAAALGLGESRA